MGHFDQRARDEIAITAQQLHGVVFYQRGVKGMEPPSGSLRGYATGIADPHGVVYDNERKELCGESRQLDGAAALQPLRSAVEGSAVYEPGRFEPPSIGVFADAAGQHGAAAAHHRRKTGLNWPMGIEVDAARDEILVANYGDDSVRSFARPRRRRRAGARHQGRRTGLVGPVDVSLDPKRNEIWVANYADHTALVFDRDATGNVAPKRIIRNGPKGSPALTFTNAAAAAYDSKRDAIIVPN